MAKKTLPVYLVPVILGGGVHAPTFQKPFQNIITPKLALAGQQMMRQQVRLHRKQNGIPSMPVKSCKKIKPGRRPCIQCKFARLQPRYRCPLAPTFH